MAYTDKLDDLWGIPQLEAQKERAVQLVKEYLQEVTTVSKKMRSMQLGIGGADNMGQMKANAKEIETLTNDQIKSIKSLADEKLKEAKAEEVLSRARLNAAKMLDAEEKKRLAATKKALAEESALLKKQAQEETHNAAARKKMFADKSAADKQAAAEQKQLEQQTKANTKAIFEYNKQVEKATIEAAKQSNAYELLKRQYHDAAYEAKRLGAELGVDSARFKEAAAGAHAMHTQLLNVEMSVGQAQRQVGNYNMVGAQFNQLLREAPNFAISMRTGIMALTNNVTYFGESIKAARKEGQSYMQILKSMGQSMFGLVGILNLAVLAITYFSLKAASAESATSKAEEATKRYKDALNEAGRSANRSAMEEQARLDILNRVATDTTKSTKARNEAVKEMQKLYPEYLANYTEEAIKAGKAAGAIDMITDAIMKRAAAMAAEKRVIASGEKILDLQQAQSKAVAEQAKAYNQLSNAQKAASQSNLQMTTVPSSGNQLLAVYELRAAMAEKNLKEINKAIADEKAMQKQFAELAVEAAGESLDVTQDKEKVVSKNEKDKKAAKERVKDLSKIQFDAQKEQIEAEINAQKIIADNEDLSYKERTEAIERYYYLKKRLIEETGEYEIMTGNKTALESEAIDKKTQSELFALTQGTLLMEGNAWDYKLKKELQVNTEREKLQKENAKRFEDNAALSEKLDKEELQRKLSFINVLTQAAQQAAAIYSKLADEKTKRELAGLDLEQEEVQNMEVRERDRAQRTVQDKAKLEETIIGIEANADAKRKDIETRRKEAERQQAQRAKELAIINVVANMVVGISKEIASKGVAGLATSAAIGVYIAALTGTIAALSVPAYAEGTPEGGHKGGGALVGERNEAEMITEPSGKTYWVNKPTYFPNMPKGTEVVPLHKLNTDGLDMTAINSIMLQGGGNNAKTERLLSQAVSKLDKISNKPTESTIIKDGSMFKTVIQGNVKHNKLRTNFLD